MVQKMWIRVTKVARAYNVARMFVICFKKIGVTIQEKQYIIIIIY